MTFELSIEISWPGVLAFHRLFTPLFTVLFSTSLYIYLPTEDTVHAFDKKTLVHNTFHHNKFISLDHPIFFSVVIQSVHDIHTTITHNYTMKGTVNVNI